MKLLNLKKIYENRRENELTFYAKNFADITEHEGVPYIAISGVPVFKITDAPSNLLTQNVCITDVNDILVNLRESYKSDKMNGKV